ncbi:MAG: permease, partial [Kangiellaceae bacterium]|nr:permease [Kangiellaceae bacterium]
MNDQLIEALKFFITVFSELAVLFILISFFVAWLNSKLPPEKVKQLLQGNRGYAVAVGLGAATPFCSC